MKFEKMIITFDSISQKKEVEKILIDKGLEFSGTRLDDCLSTYVASNFFTDIGIGLFGEPRYTYQQFMEKYGMTDLKSKIEEAKKVLGLSNQELSIKLGHERRYITNALLDSSEKRKKEIIIKIEALILKESGELTHDFQGKALNKNIDDAIMIPKSEYESMKKEIEHKTQIAEKHADMRNKAELRVSELEKECSDKDSVIKQQLLNSENQVYKINELESQVQSLQEKVIQSEQDSEKWQCDYWTVSRENIELTNQKNKITKWLSVLILVLFVMVAYGVLHFNGVV